MKKRLLAMLLCVAMLMAMLPVGVMAEPVEHASPDHCLCGSGSNANCAHSAIQWQAWGYHDSLPDTGYWYLTQPVSVSAATALTAGDDLVLCLNGQSVTMTGSDRIFHVSGGAKLTITDCGSGTITMTAGKLGAWGGAAIYVTASQLNLYGGTITGFTATNGTGGVFGGAINISNSGTFNMYGGTITGNTAGTTSSSLAYGGGVLVNGTFNMYGGTISDNKVVASGNAYGGGVFLDAGTFNMSGGTVSGNGAKAGAGVYIKAGNFTLGGGYIQSNVTTEGAGGGVRVNAGTMTMNGGEISGNTAATNGGGIYTAGNIGLTMNGGKICGNTAASNGGGAIVQGTFTMTGGEVSGNNVTVEGPGGVFGGGEMILSGNAKIYGNTMKETTPFNLRVGSKPITVGENGMGSEAKVYITYTYSEDPKIVANANDTDYSGAFYCDDETYLVSYNADKKLQLTPRPDMTGISAADVSVIEGQTKQMSAKVTPETALYGTITWASSDEAVVKVEPSGTDPLQALITGVAAGSATVTVTSSKGFSHTAAVTVLKDHKHCLCGDGQDTNCQHADQTWQPWEHSDSLPDTGYWYLTKPVQVAAATAVTGDDDLRLCLNGQTITATGTDRIFHVSAGAKLTITDCNANPGTLTVTENTVGLATGAAIYVTRSEFNLYAGKITGFTGGGASVFGGAIQIANGSTFNMYGGAITGNTGGTSESGLAYGGGVLVNGTFNMYGGEISHNEAVSTGNAYGGGVFLDAGTFNMSGGTISGNEAKSGAGVYIKAGSFTLSGGYIEDNTANVGAGGGVWVNSGSMSMSGGYVRNNSAATNGGGIYTASGIGFTMSGGTVSGNEAASNGGGAIVQGTFTMQGGEISGNNVTVEGPGGVFGGGEMILSGDAKISGNTLNSSTPFNLRVGSKPITIGDGGMGSDANVGVTYTFNETVKVIANPNDTDYSGAFFSDNTKYTVSYNADKKLVLELAVTEITLESVQLLKGESQVLTAVITPADAPYGTITWTSGDPAVVKVEQSAEDPLKATVTALELGAVTVTVSSSTGKSGSCTVTVKEKHDHCLCIDGQDANCAHEAVQWQAWIKTDSLPDKNTPGNWYLTANVELSAAEPLAAGSDVKLCLNGYSVTMKVSGQNVYHVSGGAKLSITDCKSTGVIQSAEGVTGVFGGSAAYVTGQATQFDLYAGKITGFTSVAESTFGGAIQIANGATFNMYGGEISGNCAGSQTAKLSYGGGVLVNGTFNLYGGKISANQVAATGNAYGGGVFLDAGTFNMYGGEISGNTAKNGAGVYIKAGSFTLSGGTISGNTSTEGAGGGVRVNGGAMTMTGGSVTGNTAPSNGGGIYTGSGIGFTMTGGSITGNTAASNGGGLIVQGAFVMSGGEISGNSVTTEGPGGVFAGGTITLSGDAKIINNTCGDAAYNLRVASIPVTIGENGLGENASIGVTYIGADANKYFSEECDSDYSASFTSDETKYSVRYDAPTKKLMLYIPMENPVAHADTAGYGKAGHGGDTQWIMWDIAGSLPTRSGHYYLAGTVDLEKPVTVEGDEKIVLCLNGQNIDATTAKRAYRLAKGANLTICDCTAHRNGGYVAGKIFGATNTAIMIAAEKPAVTLNLYDGAITGNYISGSGAALIIQGGATFNMYGGNLGGNKSTENGGAIFGGDGTVNLYGGSISGNTAGKYGGGVYITSKAVLNMSGGAITGNTSNGWGGGAYLGGRTYISGGSITGNKAVKEGGGVYVTDAAVTMSGGEISYNATSYNGGGLCVRGSKGVFNLKGGTVAGNKAVSSNEGAGVGGGFIVQGKGTLHISGGTIRDNECANGGGGVRTAGGSTFAMTGGTIEGNKANQGAGIQLDDVGVIEGGTIQKNIAKLDGGGVFIFMSSVTVNGGQIKDNEASTGSGGGICLTKGGRLTFNDGSISGNKAGVSGGGIRSYGCEIEINGGTLSENEAKDSGGGIYGELKLTVKDCQISDNQVTEGSGSAICLREGTALEMTNAVISGNKTASGTGALHLGKNSTATVTDSSFEANTATNGGAIYVDAGAALALSGGEITLNIADQEGSAIYADGTVALEDVSITGNTVNNGNAAVCLGGTAKNNTFAGDVIIRDNNGGELYLANGALGEVLKEGLGDKAYILLYLPGGGVSDVVLGAYNYERNEDMYTLTKGDRSVKEPDTLKKEEATVEEAPVEEGPVTQAKPQRSIDTGKVLMISAFALALLMPVIIVILLFVKKRKDDKEDGTK